MIWVGAFATVMAAAEAIGLAVRTFGIGSGQAHWLVRPLIYVHQANHHVAIFAPDGPLIRLSAVTAAAAGIVIVVRRSGYWIDAGLIVGLSTAVAGTTSNLLDVVSFGRPMDFFGIGLGPLGGYVVSAGDVCIEVSVVLVVLGIARWTRRKIPRRRGDVFREAMREREPYPDREPIDCRREMAQLLPRLPRVEALIGSRLSEIDSAVVQRIIDLGVREDTDLDFKREAYEPAERGNRDVATDVAAMANGPGGAIFLGIRAHDGAAAELMPITFFTKEPLFSVCSECSCRSRWPPISLAW